MKKKEFIIVFAILLFIIIGISLIFVADRVVEEIKLSKSSVIVDGIFEKIDNKEDVLMFIKDEESDYYMSLDAENFINYYEEVYGLDFIHIDRSKIRKEDYKRILDKFYIEEKIIEIPFAILVKNGEFNAMVNQLVMETYLRNYLIEGGFIDKRHENIDQSISYEKFQELYSSEEKSLFAIYTYTDGGSYDIRKSLFEINEKFPINYYIVFDGVSNDSDISRDLKLDLDDNFKIPALVITEKSRVIDYISSIDKDEIINFLRKYDFID